MGVPPLFGGGGGKGATLPQHFPVFAVVRRPETSLWWIVGSMPHQKKPRLLVSSVQENFSFQFKEELSGRLGTLPPLVPPAMPPGES